MADQALNDVTQQELLGAFEAVEHSPQLEGHHARYLEMADTLAKRFGVAKTVPAAAHAHACCGHHK
jgi:hypothetical protein